MGVRIQPDTAHKTFQTYLAKKYGRHRIPRGPWECEWDRFGEQVVPNGQGKGRLEEVRDRLLPRALDAEAPRPGQVDGGDHQEREELQHARRPGGSHAKPADYPDLR